MEHLEYSKDLILMMMIMMKILLVFQDLTFMNQKNQNEYYQKRKDIFENEITDIYLMVDSFQSTSASTFTYTFCHPGNTSQDTGGHDVYKNVIGIQLKRVLINASLSNEIAIDIMIPIYLIWRVLIIVRHHTLTRMVIKNGYNDYEPSMYYENTFLSYIAQSFRCSHTQRVIAL